jgi:hypothetical protein
MNSNTANLWGRRALLNSVLALPTGRAAATGPSRQPAAETPQSTPSASVSPPSGRCVGIAYALWHKDVRWQDAPGPRKPWGTPELGYYRSDDPAIVARHAGWLSGTGVDFVVIDWSNDLAVDIRQKGGMPTLRFIEQATIGLFDAWAAQAAAPRVTLMIGNPGEPDAVKNGKLKGKADEVYALFVASPSRARMLQTYLGKPLLLVYVGTPSPWGHSLPPWQDDRFTVRFVSGFLTQQLTLLGSGTVSRYGYWSWEDRRQPTYAVFQGYPECMTVVAAWRGKGSPGRDGGQTYLSQWTHARKIGPRFVLAGTFNEWWLSEQDSPEASKDIEPSREYGWRYMDILKEQVALFKAGK